MSVRGKTAHLTTKQAVCLPSAFLWPYAGPDAHVLRLKGYGTPLLSAAVSLGLLHVLL